MKNKNYTNKNVKFLREHKKITQEKMADDLGIDQSTLAKWENNSRKITLEWALNISDYFKINIGDFIAKDLQKIIYSNKESK